MDNLGIFYELSDYISIRINSCRCEFHDVNWKESKTHNDYDLWVILEGNMTIETDGRVFRAGEGDAVFFCPDIYYTAHIGSHGCRFIYIHFNFSIGNNHSFLERFNLWGIIRGKNNRELHEKVLLFKMAYEEYNLKKSMSSMLLKGSFTMLLAVIVTIGTDRREEDCFIAKNHKKKTSGSFSILQPALSYIAKNIHKGVKVSELSKVAGISEKYFITYFKGALGVSPGKYINQLRMNRAREYLYERKYSIKEISFMLGYPNQYAFSKSFKKYYNVPPSRFI